MAVVGHGVLFHLRLICSVYYVLFGEDIRASFTESSVSELTVDTFQLFSSELFISSTSVDKLKLCPRVL